MTMPPRTTFLLAVAASALVACATQDVETSTVEDALTCTPGQQTCDYGCFFQGGPSTNDCIIRCNATGTGWITIQDCGWAQNFPFSSSCFPSQPRAVCQLN
jgi:hypothetical protein